jgi:hypothetical protein
MKTSPVLLLGAALAATLVTTGCKKESDEEAPAKTAAPTAAPTTVEATPELVNADATASAEASASAAPPPPPPAPAARVDVCDQVLRAAAAGKCTEARNLVPSCSGPKALAAKSSIVACLKGR